MSQARVQAGLKFENLLVITDLSVESGAATPEKEVRGFLPDEIKPHVDHVIVEFGPVAAGVAEFALAKKADVIVLGVKSGGSLTRGATHLPWAIAHQIIADAPCPVITVREPARPAEI